MLFKLIWLLLQTCFTIYQNLQQLFQQLKKVSWSYDRRRENGGCTSFLTDCEYIFLEHCRKQLKKIPHHLSLIIGPNEAISEEVVTKILRYALEMKIDCVSFYDTRPSEKNRIRLHKIRHPKDIISKELNKRHLLWTTHSVLNGYDIPNGKPASIMNNGYTNKNGLNGTNGHKNGFKGGQSIEIYEIESTDGRALISEVCRKLFALRQTDEVQKLLQNRTLLMERIDKDLSLHLWKHKDPELCIIFSKHLCTFGMLPWHTRFTEFYIHQQNDLFDAKTFAEILFQYSRCEQRWGI